MTVEVTMATCTVQTHLDFLMRKRSTNETKITALSQSLVTLNTELANKEKALAESSKQLLNAMEAIQTHLAQGHYCEMSMFTAQDEARLAEVAANKKKQLAEAAVTACEHDLQAAGVRSATLDASIQEEQTRVAELETHEQQREAQ